MKLDSTREKVHVFANYFGAKQELLGEHKKSEVPFSYFAIRAGEALVFHKSMIHLPVVSPVPTNCLGLSIRFVPRKNFCTLECVFPKVLQCPIIEPPQADNSDKAVQTFCAKKLRSTLCRLT
jgi:hypothetical protein